MSLALPWTNIGLVQVLTQLLRVVRDELDATPPENSRTIKKLERWLGQIEYIMRQIRRIRDKLFPRLRATLGIQSQGEELLLVAMFQPSTKNLFLEIRSHFCNGPDPPLDCDTLGRLVSLSEMAKVLALIGDAAISLAVLHHLWEPYVSQVGGLTQMRAWSVSNEHLAALCDTWHLYEHRIHFDPPAESKSEIEHHKGTLVEAVYGVVYVMRGIDGVIESASPLMAGLDIAHARKTGER